MREDSSLFHATSNGLDSSIRVIRGRKEDQKEEEEEVDTQTKWGWERVDVRDADAR